MLLDGLTVIDRPAPGTYVYSAQMSTSTPETVCTAYQGGGVTPCRACWCRCSTGRDTVPSWRRAGKRQILAAA